MLAVLCVFHRDVPPCDHHKNNDCGIVLTQILRPICWNGDDVNNASKRRHRLLGLDVAWCYLSGSSYFLPDYRGH